MHNPSLPHLLRGIKTPTLLVRGTSDEVVPRGCIDAYQEALGGAQVAEIEGAGHRPEIEKPLDFVKSGQQISGCLINQPRGFAMKIGYFTERPYRSVPEDEVFKHRSFFGLSNKFFDPIKGSADYRYYIEEYRYAEELGFDLVALNEHHGNPFCLGSVMNVEASVLAYATKRVRIVLIGNPLPVLKHPLRMAEELAEIDLISQGQAGHRMGARRGQRTVFQQR